MVEADSPVSRGREHAAADQGIALGVRPIVEYGDGIEGTSGEGRVGVVSRRTKRKRLGQCQRGGESLAALARPFE